MRRPRHDVRRSGALLGALLVALLLPLLALAGSPSASAADTGRISGRVTDIAGAGVPATVVAIRYVPPSSFIEHSRVRTDGVGRYVLSGLPAGSYRLQFQPTANLVGEYWRDAGSLFHADDVVVAEGAVVTGRNAALEPGAEVRGRAVGPAGEPVEGIAVTAYRFDSALGIWDWAGLAHTDSDGRYALSRLRAGSYRFGFADWMSGEWVEEFWKDSDSLTGATTVDVAGAAVRTGISPTLARAGVLQGSVTDQRGRPIARALVTATRRSTDGVSNGRVMITGSDGRYRISGLRPGDYTLRFDDGSAHLPEYWDDQVAVRDADPVAIVAGRTTDGIDAALADPAHLVGRVTDEVSGAPLAGIEVSAHELTSQGWSMLTHRAVTGADGRYDIGGLRGGAYRLEVVDPTAAHRSEFWPDRPSFRTAGDVTVAPGASVSRSVALAPAGRITGRVVGAGGNGPLAGVRVVVYRYDAARSLWAELGEWLGGPTDDEGRYEIGPLAPGTYRLGFEPGYIGYLRGFWKDAADVDDAVDVTVGAGGTVALGDARLTPGGHVRGRVTGPDGAPVASAEVTAYRLTIDERGRAFRAVATDYTGTDGSYDLDRLQPGRYRVGFRARTTTGVTGEFYENAASLADATDVPVRSTEVVDGIDAQLAFGGRLTGVVTAPDGTRLPGINVSAYRKVGHDYQSFWGTVTDARGRYDLWGVPPGTYRIGFSDERERDWAPEFSDDRPDLASASDVVVAAGETMTRRAELAPAGHVTGRVTGPDGDPLWGVTVRPYRREPDTGRWVRVRTSDDDVRSFTDPTGAYDLAGLQAGTYRLEFSPSAGTGVAREFWDDAATVDLATDLVVATGQTVPGADAQLDVPGHVTGRVTGSGGGGLGSVEVTAYAFDPGRADWTPVSSTYTDELGGYDLGDLGAGAYRLGFRDLRDVLADEYWSDQPTIETARDVVVSEGGTVTRRDAVLQTLGSGLLGTLRGTDGAPVEGTVVVHRQGRNGAFRTYAETRTGPRYDGGGNGEFSVIRLPPGSYRLEFDPDDPALRTEFWDDATTLATATTITVTAGQRVTGLDPVLTAG